MNGMTEKEAGERFCPFTFACGRGDHCMGSLCMAWRWVARSEASAGVPAPRRGECSLLSSSSKIPRALVRAHEFLSDEGNFSSVAIAEARRIANEVEKTL